VVKDDCKQALKNSLVGFCSSKSQSFQNTSSTKSTLYIVLLYSDSFFVHNLIFKKKFSNLWQVRWYREELVKFWTLLHRA
jgi:hypothetical protein